MVLIQLMYLATPLITESDIFPLSTVASIRDFAIKKYIQPFSTEIILAGINTSLGVFIAVRVKYNTTEIAKMNKIIQNYKNRREDLEYLMFKKQLMNPMYQVKFPEIRQVSNCRTVKNSELIICKCGDSMIKCF